ncbi:hypothetical protein FRACYDRAFT_237473 [Fragilariopsis cylindrus CCMP1102]|uniref:Uncharacterized protein n=1 Tax=Fragilariopsis cylindrus CCMP1102 TaxID=635003 RepID=A0A1E7FN07_9STRA|nr:hypothetical protein FRACYDRAFT_237473 [Fragilariopsis cylindrus CCMP1102]|eukprot:OEU19183.1 hypothetical protein FRACYDRAFT_237473 [Fragilariopsis cylindrus CCMP1102]
MFRVVVATASLIGIAALSISIIGYDPSLIIGCDDRSFNSNKNNLFVVDAFVTTTSKSKLKSNRRQRERIRRRRGNFSNQLSSSSLSRRKESSSQLEMVLPHFGNFEFIESANAATTMTNILPFKGIANQFQGSTNNVPVVLQLKDYAPQATNLFNNMKLPASIVTAGMISLGFATSFPELPRDTVERVYSPELRERCEGLKRLHIVVALVAVTSELIVVLFAAVEVNQLTERLYEPALSVWDLIQRDCDLAWSAVNSHFVLGIIGFVTMLAIRAYVMLIASSASNELMTASLTGITASLCLMISIVNRGVESGGGTTDARYGSTILDLFVHYAELLFKSAINVNDPGPLQFSAICLQAISFFFLLNVLLLDNGKMDYNYCDDDSCSIDNMLLIENNENDNENETNTKDDTNDEDIKYLNSLTRINGNSTTTTTAAAAIDIEDEDSDGEEFVDDRTTVYKAVVEEEVKLVDNVVEVKAEEEENEDIDNDNHNNNHEDYEELTENEIKVQKIILKLKDEAERRKNDPSIELLEEEERRRKDDNDSSSIFS